MQYVWPLLVAALNLAADGQSEQPTLEYQLVAPKPGDLIPSAINERGDLIGFEWIEEQEHPGVLTQAPFYSRGQDMVYLPKLKGYTATFPADLSDEGQVVGRVSRPLQPGVRIPFLNQAFLWDSESGIRGLGALEGDTASFASAITRDGQRISGISIGENRMRACVWERDGAGWKCRALPQAHRLGSNVVAMSDDGRSIAAVDGATACLWTEDASGTWSRTEIAQPGELVPRGVNNAGMVVGLRYTDDGLTHAVLWTRDEGYRAIEMPEGYARSEALAVNNHGVVVGFMDGPHGSEIMPRGFLYQQGRLRLLVEGPLEIVSVNAINDQNQVAGVVEQGAED